jgi:3-mercaptopyruvate sulfurtransferase SseA
MRFIIFFLAVVVLALAVLSACNSAEWKDVRTSPGAPVGTPPPAAPADGVRRVTIAELKDMLARDEVLVIDVRTQASYNVGHIRGAKLIPEAEVVDHLDELPRNKLIVTYCS